MTVQLRTCLVLDNQVATARLGGATFLGLSYYTMGQTL